eukprot:364265-Chlamydomonas_euryale.AAC.13
MFSGFDSAVRSSTSDHGFCCFSTAAAVSLSLPTATDTIELNPVVTTAVFCSALADAGTADMPSRVLRCRPGGLWRRKAAAGPTSWRSQSDGPRRSPSK